MRLTNWITHIFFWHCCIMFCNCAKSRLALVVKCLQKHDYCKICIRFYVKSSSLSWQNHSNVDCCLSAVRVCVVLFLFSVFRLHSTIALHQTGKKQIFPHNHVSKIRKWLSPCHGSITAPSPAIPPSRSSTQDLNKTRAFPPIPP